MSDGLCECGCGEPAPIATKTDRAFGWIKGQPKRFVNGHQNRKGLRHIEEDRGYVTPCWIWQGACDTQGYGLTSLERRRMQAHRRYYELSVGPIPTGAELDHLCHVRACVRPDHLEPVTHAENMRRAAVARLGPGAVAEIRRSRGVVTQRALAGRYGVHVSTIARVMQDKSWAQA